MPHGSLVPSQISSLKEFKVLLTVRVINLGIDCSRSKQAKLISLLLHQLNVLLVLVIQLSILQSALFLHLVSVLGFLHGLSSLFHLLLEVLFEKLSLFLFV